MYIMHFSLFTIEYSPFPIFTIFTTVIACRMETCLLFHYCWFFIKLSYFRTFFYIRKPAVCLIPDYF